MRAIEYARVGAARISGIRSKSGGIGKNELSMKATNAKAQRARGCSAIESVQSYIHFIMRHLFNEP